MLAQILATCAYVRACTSVRARVYVCVCVCVRERGGESQIKTKEYSGEVLGEVFFRSDIKGKIAVSLSLVLTSSPFIIMVLQYNLSDLYEQEVG